MKRKNLICLLLVLSMSATFFMSCDDSSNKNPADTDAKTSGSTAAEEITSEETTSTTENTSTAETESTGEMDSSVAAAYDALSEEEKYKLEPWVLRQMINSAPDAEITVDIKLHKTVTDDEFEAAVQEQIEENRIKAEEIHALINYYKEEAKYCDDILSMDMETFEAQRPNQYEESSKSSYHGRSRYYHRRVKELTTELKEYSTDYYVASQQTAKKLYFPILNNFLKSYNFLELTITKYPPEMVLEDVPLTPAQICELAKDERVNFFSKKGNFDPSQGDI